MPFEFRAHRSVLWLLLAAVVLSAVFQSSWMRHAISAKTGSSSVVEICTGVGMKWVDLTTGEVREAPGDSAPGSTLDHCPCCTTQAVTNTSDSVDRQIFLPLLSNALPYLYWHAPRPLFVWTHANPRAPPARA